MIKIPACPLTGFVVAAAVIVWCARFSVAGEALPQAIDRFVSKAQIRDKAEPAGLADDVEFVRRVYLDMIGRIPTRAEAHRFVGNTDPAKRSRLIDQLLASGEYAKHWRENLHTYLMGGAPFVGDAEWRDWLENALKHNQGWDTMARTMLRARPAKPEDNGARHFLISRFAQSPTGLDAATRDVSRLFFGVDIQCARCHKHPEVDLWKQESYWGMAAFWNRSYTLPIKGRIYLAERATGEVDYTTKTSVTKVAEPRFLGGEKLLEVKMTVANAKPRPDGKGANPTADNPADYVVPPETAATKTRVPQPKFSRREKLVELAINGNSPYFKRAAVNYVWSQLFGRGLVEPIDQMHEGNPASHPELLAFLADDFAAQGFDQKAWDQIEGELKALNAKTWAPVVLTLWNEMLIKMLRDRALPKEILTGKQLTKMEAHAAFARWLAGQSAVVKGKMIGALLPGALFPSGRKVQQARDRAEQGMENVCLVHGQP
jgi:hypothetical protein